jgi:hypothetical protein
MQNFLLNPNPTCVQCAVVWYKYASKYWHGIFYHTSKEIICQGKFQGNGPKDFEDVHLRRDDKFSGKAPQGAFAFYNLFFDGYKLRMMLVTMLVIRPRLTSTTSTSNLGASLE